MSKTIYADHGLTICPFPEPAHDCIRKNTAGNDSLGVGGLGDGGGGLRLGGGEGGALVDCRQEHPGGVASQ